MRDAIARRKKTHRFSAKKLLFSFFWILILGLIVATFFYSIPTIFAYLSQKGYISPLASRLSLHEALGNSVTQETVKKQSEKAGFIVANITEYDDGYMMTLKTGEKILFSKKKPLEQQISSLQLISSRLTIEGKHFAQLDLRFDRPVLVPK